MSPYEMRILKVFTGTSFTSTSVSVYRSTKDNFILSMTSLNGDLCFVSTSNPDLVSNFDKNYRVS